MTPWGRPPSPYLLPSGSGRGVPIWKWAALAMGAGLTVFLSVMTALRTQEVYDACLCTSKVEDRDREVVDFGRPLCFATQRSGHVGSKGERVTYADTLFYKCRGQTYQASFYVKAFSRDTSVSVMPLDIEGAGKFRVGVQLFGGRILAAYQDRVNRRPSRVRDVGPARRRDSLLVDSLARLAPPYPSTAH